MTERHSASRAEPERLVLPVRDGVEPSGAPPVRIFLGTEPAQWRAERVFFWSIERHRDPAREIEIFPMRGLSGFRCRGWTTGFTNYRFAVAHFAGRHGRAIYNDVDQIYCADPGELFDADLGGHGYLAVDARDSSVMLLDCAQMAGVWSLAAARSEKKSQLLERAAALRGDLGREWNARDDEYEPGRSKLLHFTTLHTQPWRPFPERFVYRENRHADVWHALEREADAAGAEVHGRERPSEEFRRRAPDGGCRLEDVPDQDVPWFLDEMARSAGERLRATVTCAARPHSWLGRLSALGAPPRASHTKEWWTEHFERAAKRHPQRGFSIELRVPSGRDEVLQDVVSFGRRESDTLPRVWVLADDRSGNTSQSLGLAEALGWPTEVKQLAPRLRSVLSNRLLGASLAGYDPKRSTPLGPPWPDLVIAAGRRTAPAALWVRECSGWHTKLVALGRKCGDAADLFDLSVTPAYAGLFEHPRRVVTAAPLQFVNERRLAEAAQCWKERLAHLRAPRIALLVGGESGQYRLDAKTATDLGAVARGMASAAGGSLLVTTSRRTGAAATRALREALDGDAFLHAFAPDDDENPYLGFLALADAIVITGDSESMLAEATQLGKPVYIAPLPERASFRALALPRELVSRCARSEPLGPRGTPRPQRGLEYLCARLIDRGLVRPTRDLSRLHDDLVRRGVARRFGEPFEPAGIAALRDLEDVVARVRDTMGVGPA